ncbi:MAG TPA: transcriptional regulator NrdR [Thermoleophilaceae bacterium]
MHCPFCDFDSTRVVDSRLSEAGDAIRRRRECGRCKRRITTYERAEEPAITVIKRDGSRERFDRQKLLRGLVRAAGGREVSGEQLEALVGTIANALRHGGSEVKAEEVGDLAERGLARLDPVAAIQFASVYRNLADLDELAAVVQRYKEEPLPGADQLPLQGLSSPSDPEVSIGRSPLKGPAQSIESRSPNVP